MNGDEGKPGSYNTGLPAADSDGVVLSNPHSLQKECAKSIFSGLSPILSDRYHA